ncbi:EAL domain-containing protein [Shewanella gaetbuli]|uniref:GGDEF domain-containing protein n=1 Tax=Shewanella gaetbuli TaxID=220752 RepID=A0A9X1ZHL8_9GAMM|nr:GGDEF domain-containing protein [Shewanella gaetbuli]MCL1142464.1 GGDEF domain-containing protein [Shewanella gaetbuli]
MGLSKSFQLVLFIIFGLLLYRFYSLENSEVQLKSEVVRQSLSQNIKKHSDWAENGKALYDTLSQDHKFQFFQYIHNTDKNYNFTHGSVAPVDKSFKDKLFNTNLEDSQQFANGRLQVRLEAQSIIDPSLKELQAIAEIIILTYLLLMIIFAFLINLHKRKVRYAAQYVDSISNLTFQAVEVSRLNGILKPLGLALESCRARLKQSLEQIKLENEKLTKAAYQDPISGFSTRPRFLTFLDSVTQKNKNSFGVLLHIKASELANINQMHGRTAGDDYLAKMADCIRRAAASKNLKSENYRISSGDYAVFLEDTTLKQSQSFVEKLKQQLDDYSQSSQVDSVAHIGIVPYQYGNDPVTILSMADSAVSIAQTFGPNRYHYLEKFEGNEKFGDDQWKSTISNILKSNSVNFYYQPILPCNTDHDLYRELLSRFYNHEGKHLPTATVIAMSERYGLNIDLDKLIVTNAIKLLKDNPRLTGLYAVNISASSAIQDIFIYWLKETLTHNKREASRLIFEINESGMQVNLNASYNFVSEVHKAGAKVAVERFGLGFTSFKFFREVRPDYIKLDNSYSDNIEADNNNKFFVRMIVDIAKRLDILVLATGVEKQDEKLTLEKLLVDGLQGYYIAKPEPVIKSD